MQLVGRIEDFFVSIGRGVEEDETVALVDRSAAQEVVLGGGPHHVIHRRHESNDLVDRPRRDAGLPAPARELRRFLSISTSRPLPIEPRGVS